MKKSVMNYSQEHPKHRLGVLVFRIDMQKSLMIIILMPDASLVMLFETTVSFYKSVQ